MRTDAQRLRDIIQAIDEIAIYDTGGAARESELVLNWAVHRIVIIGEAASELSDEIRDHLSAIPWAQVVGMRNRLVHGYFTVDPDIIWQTVTVDLQPMRELIVDYLRSQQ